jgi:CRP-like cAMP-binding protein
MTAAAPENPHLRNRLLASLHADDLAALEPHLREVLLLVGNALHRPGEKIEQVYFLHDGVVSLMAVMEDGTMVETVSVGHEGAIGTIEGFGSLQAFTCALVQVPGTASRMPGVLFRRFIAENDELREIVNQYHMAVMASVQQTSACNAFHDLTSRLSRILLLVGDRCADSVRLTQETLAGMLGVQRTSVTSVVRELRSLGAIDYQRGTIKILDRDKLKGSACECYGTIRRSVDIGFKPAQGSQNES